MARAMAKIEWVKCESHSGIITSWTAQFTNGTQETYNGETPPQNVSRFCAKARYGYKDMCGEFLGDIMYDWHSIKPLTTKYREACGV